ncbi:MFS transporter [Pandoraea terrae]|nr:MFS transporter [Pandoraea terrae]
MLIEQRSTTDTTEAPARPAHGRRYPIYVLLVLTLVSCVSALDRQIFSILAQSIKHDLGLTDTEMGFLFGTAFAVFHALFGLMLARLADGWSRQRLIAAALVAWSAITGFNGLAGNFWQLLAARMGVSIGESVASPAAFSLLAEWFPARRRATALAVYSGGAFVGAGLGLALGGAVAHAWDMHFAGAAPLNLRGWQVAFFAAGAPGLCLALWVRTLRSHAPRLRDARLAPLVWREMRLAVPPLNCLAVLQQRDGALLRDNLVLMAALTVLASGIASWSGDWVQWLLLALGVYAAGTWLQLLNRSEPQVAALFIRRRTLTFLSLGCGFASAINAATAMWMAPFLIRTYGLNIAQAGWQLGVAFAASGWLGVIIGGVAADRLREITPRGRIHVATLATALPLPFLWLSIHAATAVGAVSWLFFANLFATLWVAAGSTSVQELTPLHARATASAFYLLVVTYVGMALGPYTVGKLSDALGNLGSAILSQACVTAALACLCFVFAARHVAREQLPE